MTPIEIEGRRVGPDRPVLVIAEAGSNHNGDLNQAYALIEASARAGADAVKFQTFHAETMYPRRAGSVEYLKAMGIDRPIFDLIREMEMPRDWIPRLADRARAQGILFLSTPFDEETVDLLLPFVGAYKIASYELTHIPLIAHAARTGKPLLLSTGAAVEPEIDEAVFAARSEGRGGVALLQCTAKYPAPLDSMNLRVLDYMASRWKVPVGLSDHSREATLAPIAAVARGAAIIEKHFTLDRRFPGPDHSFALEPDELAAMVRAIRETERALGTGRKEPHPVEEELLHFRRGLFTVRPLRAGSIIAPGDVAALRKGGIRDPGLPPKVIYRLVGRIVRRDLPEGTLLRSDDIDPSLE